MKKIVSAFLALMMLCSLMVVNVSASNTYEGEGFRIVTDYSGYIEGGYESDDTYAYDFHCNDLGDEARIQIFVLASDSAEEAEQGFNEEFYGYGEEITLGGRPAVADADEEDFFCNIYTYSDKYIFDIEVEGSDSYSYEVLCEIIEGIEFGEPQKSDESKTKVTYGGHLVEDPNSTTIIIIAVVVIAVVLIGVVAVVVIHKKKIKSKQ